MPGAIRSLVPHALVVACLSLAAVGTADAQEPLDRAPDARPQFLSRYDFHLEAESLLSGGDTRFRWDTHWGGDFDFIDYVRGRLSFLADYQAVLGHEFQPFDPIQGNYTLEVSSSVRLGRMELAGVLHHLSRHLGDRPKTFGIAHNVVEARLMRRLERAQDVLTIRVEGGKVTERSTFVDYTWRAAAEAVARRRVSPRREWFGRLFGEVIAVDESIARRGTQAGGRIEVGLRITGTSAAMELFGGFERVIDADPLDRMPRQWPVGGFRLVSQ
jgi:hypothetical protein